MKTRRPVKTVSFLPPGLSRFRTAGSFRFSKGALPGLVRKVSGAGEAKGKDAPTRGQAWLGLVLYGLLIPFGIRALWAHYWVTGPLLLGIGLAGAAGIAVRNLGPRSGLPKNAPDERSAR